MILIELSHFRKDWIRVKKGNYLADEPLDFWIAYSCVASNGTLPLSVRWIALIFFGTRERTKIEKRRCLPIEPSRG